MKWRKMTIALACEGGRRAREGWVTDAHPGIAVTPNVENRGYYHITHIDSGKIVAPCAWKTLPTAKRALVHIGGFGNWSRPTEEVFNDNVLKEMVRIFAWTGPGKRPVTASAGQGPKE